MKREEQEQHNEIWMNEHLQLAVKEITELKSEKKCLQSQLKNLPNQYRPVIKMSGFAKVKDEGNSWYSPGFYTSPGGYKMCLRVYVNGDGDGTHVSCYIYLMSGEYDDILEWPFHGKVTIQLLNQLKDKNHHKMVVHFVSSTPLECKSRVFGGKLAEGWGKPRFISHSQLDVNPSLNCQYLKDDTLYFRVSVEVTSITKPWLVAYHVAMIVG
jgi:TNF receptor-associated factor 4